MSIKTNKQIDQSGFASIVVALIMILVLSLVTLGFAQLARREQQNTLSRQLAAQATYAAESGINDVYKIIDTLEAAEKATPGTIDPKKCLGAPYLTSSTIDSTTGVSYTCVLVNLKPRDIVYSGVSPQSGRNIKFSTTAAPKTLSINWGSSDGQTNAYSAGPNSGKFDTLASWSAGKYLPVLEISLTPFDNALVDRNSLIGSTFTAYLYPKNGASGATSVAYSGAPNAPIVYANCGNPGTHKCRVTITGIPDKNGYVLHLIPYYDTADISIDGSDASNNPIGFIDGQVQIDVTGRAKDVLKRIQVHAPLKITGNVPPSAVEAQSVCKRFNTAPSSTTYDLATSPDCVLGP